MGLEYRNDIDGLRAIAVCSVILFHLSFLPCGFLGVDVFFVISGFLITGIIQKQRHEGTFTLKQFYIKRIRRILPLLLVVCCFVLVVSFFIMLPDDLENVAESVVATDFFSNNMLSYNTLHNYWAPKAHYLPLTHTWTLAIEEQFYVLFPLLFLVFKKQKKLFVALLLLTVISALFYFTAQNANARFYFSHMRFFEFGVGALISFMVHKITLPNALRSVAILLLIALFALGKYLPTISLIPLTVVLSSILVLPVKERYLFKFLLENPLVVFIGKLSFSLYLWHQPVLAFMRYLLGNELNASKTAAAVLAIVLLSLTGYYLIEKPFRNPRLIKTKHLYAFTIGLLLLTSGCGLWLYAHAGVVRDVPELDIYSGQGVRNMNIAYNERVYGIDREFVNNNKKKVLVIGHSFARDWANVLLESRYKDTMQLSYIYELDKCKNAQGRLDAADVIFITAMHLKDFEVIKKRFTINMSKVKIIGIKNFGNSNGVFYNNRDTDNYCMQRVYLSSSIIKLNNKYKEEWGSKYIDFINVVVDDKGSVPVFTPNCKFISQDGKHFTRAGAKWYARIIDKMPYLE